MAGISSSNSPMDRRRIATDRLSQFGIEPGRSALPPLEQLPLERLAEHNIVKVFEKIDYIAFARMRRTCRYVGDLIEDTIGQYKITVPIDIVVDWEARGKWSVSKKPGAITKGVLYVCPPADLDPSGCVVPLRYWPGMPDERKKPEYRNWVVNSLEASLRGYRWKTIELTDDSESDPDNKNPTFELLEEVMDMVVTLCDTLRFSRVSLADMEAWIDRKTPSTVAIISQLATLDELTYLPKLMSVPNIEFTSPEIQSGSIEQFCRGRKSISLQYLKDDVNFSFFNEILAFWQNGSCSLEFLEVKTKKAGAAPPGLIAHLDTIEFFYGKLDSLHTMENRPQKSNITVQAWLIRSRATENNYPLYGLLTYRFSSGLPSVATFRKLPRDPQCLCDNPICVDALAPLFFDFVHFCFPIDLSTFRDELFHKPAVPFLGRQFELYIFHQKRLLAQPQRNPSSWAKTIACQ